MKARIAALVTALGLTLPAPARAQSCSTGGGLPPDLLIVLDRSSSMGQTVGSATKWAHAKTAITYLTSTYAGKIRFGLLVFPPGGLSSLGDADCPPPCDPDSLEECVDLCVDVTCPDGTYCSKGECVPWPSAPPAVEGGVGEGEGAGFSGEGGCACRVSILGPSDLGPLLVLAVLCLARRRGRAGGRR
jgi:hypothetical protein